MSAPVAHSREAILQDIASKLPVKPNARKRLIWMVCIAIGVAAFVFLLMTEPRRAWGAWTINTIFFLGISMAGGVLASAIRLCNGRWAGPIQRIGEGLTSFVPWGIGFMAALLGAGIWYVLPWTHEVLERQKPFLNVPFLWIRTMGGLFLFWWLSTRMRNISLRTDARLLQPYVAPELRPAYERLASGWRGDDQEIAWQRHELAHLSPQIVLTFVVFFSVMAWDFIMAITPNWASALFGWYVYAAAFLNGCAMTAFLGTQVRSKYRLEAYITPNHFWDIGKVIFSFSIFWVYLFWSQYLPIWYANMPEETWWVFIRFEQPWRTLSFTVFSMIFVIPFFGMMNKTSKTNPFLLASFCVLIMSGVWLERHVLVMPSLHPESVWVGLPEVGVMLGFLGAFGWVIQSFLTRYPCVNVKDALAPKTHGAH